nr:MAG TPA: hypothetical protein [Caudoviricetes sp.]
MPVVNLVVCVVGYLVVSKVRAVTLAVYTL